MGREIPALRCYARALCRDAVRADDLVQDCLERALRKRHLWARRGSLRAWLFRILYREFLNGKRRKRESAPHLSIEHDAPTLTQPPSQSDHAHCRDVLTALAALPRDQRSAIALIALENFSYDEAAQILGVPVGTLRSRLARGRQALRDTVAVATRWDGAEEAGGHRTQAHLRRVK